MLSNGPPTLSKGLHQAKLANGESGRETDLYINKHVVCDSSGVYLFSEQSLAHTHRVLKYSTRPGPGRA